MSITSTRTPHFGYQLGYKTKDMLFYGPTQGSAQAGISNIPSPLYRIKANTFLYSRLKELFPTPDKCSSSKERLIELWTIALLKYYLKESQTSGYSIAHKVIDAFDEVEHAFSNTRGKKISAFNTRLKDGIELLTKEQKNLFSFSAPLSESIEQDKYIKLSKTESRYQKLVSFLENAASIQHSYPEEVEKALTTLKAKLNKEQFKEATTAVRNYVIGGIELLNA